MRSTVCLALFALLATLPVSAALASTPEVSSVEPLGGTRGTTVELNLRGARLAAPQELIIYEPGITVARLEVVGEQNDCVKAVLNIAPDARLGQYHVRLRTSNGFGHLHTFWVGALAIVPEAEPNSSFSEPQKIAGSVTVDGVVENEDIDYYAVEAKKGQLISVEVEAIRLGRVLFDAALTILDADRFELAASDDTPLLAQDCFAQAVAPADGTYVVAVRESSFGGAGNFRYRLHIGSFPRPTVVYPAGGPAGEPLDITLLGDAAGPLTKNVAMPALPASTFGVFAERETHVSPSPNMLRVSPFANVLEVEPNNGFEQATVASELPVALNGIIGQDGDVDIFRIKLAAGQVVDIRLFARAIGSPLDPVLDLFNSTPGHLGGNDDVGTSLDSYMRFTAPAEGDYHVHVRDQLLKGGPDYVYRVEITTVSPMLSLIIPEVARDDHQNRQWIAVPRGNRWMSLVQANRVDFGGPLQIHADGLPPGVTMSAPTISESVGTMGVVFEAAADAPIGGTLIELLARHADPNVAISGRYEQTVALVRGSPNNTPYYTTKVDRIAVAVIEKAPFSVRLVEPKVPVLQSGAMNLRIVAEKEPGWDEEIRVQLPFRPPGLNAQYEVVIPKGQTEVLSPVNANGDAAVGDWQLAVNAWASVGGGQVWVASPIVKLTVAPYFFTGQVQMAAAEQGKPVDVLVKLQTGAAFEGEARLELVGLPHKVTSAPVQITKASTDVTFHLQIDPASPAGQHPSLFCQLTLEKDGEVMTQTLAGGGTLRIDAPRPAPVVAAAAPAAAPAAQPAPAAAPAPLSRLEQLRLERSKRNGAQGG